ncbi:hypothetical protein [Leptotrichia sp. oral taxon 221]|jgi:hypothetical protein|uniref:hypothetical protein n=1 Tax=Leptotrichia sp. oral taxon 221 TaxID=712362 RepID=UPI001B8B16F8|nr:hypothetical protein [Leptotrichia sp. oral taxon 221]QUB96591.1 hypothetical protein J4863_05820 [Leptotrichia sp. oral taxon 221]
MDKNTLNKEMKDNNSKNNFKKLLLSNQFIEDLLKNFKINSENEKNKIISQLENMVDENLNDILNTTGCNIETISPEDLSSEFLEIFRNGIIDSVKKISEKNSQKIIENETPTEWIWEDSFARPLERKEEWFEFFLSTKLSYRDELPGEKYLERYFALEGRRLFQDYDTGEIIVYLGGYLLARIIKSPDIIKRRYYIKEVYNDFHRDSLISQIAGIGNTKIDISKMMKILDEYEKVFFNCISDTQNSLDNAYYTWLLKDTVFNGQYPDIKLLYEYDSKYIVDDVRLLFSFAPFFNIDGKMVSEDIYMDVVYESMEYDTKKLIYSYLKNIFTFSKNNLDNQDGNSFYSYVIENDVLYKISFMHANVRYHGNPIEVIE